MASNEFLPFCPTDTGSNLLTEAEYTVATNRTIGNQPGVASSKLNNKAIRQANMIASQLAQFISNNKGLDVIDDGVTDKLLAQITATFKQHLPVLTVYASGTGTHNLTYKFTIATGSATIGATYTNNGVTFTVVATVAAGLQINMTGNGDPLVAGTLTKASGTGDATLTFYAFAKARVLEIQAYGGGGGGGGSSVFASANGGVGGTGGNTTFGTTMIIASGGGGGLAGSNGGGGGGGAATLGTGPIGVHAAGGNGSGGVVSVVVNATAAGGVGAASPLGGAGGSGAGAGTAGTAAKTNSGSGGGGASGNSSSPGYAGGGGGAGGYVDAEINAPASSYAYAIGTAGTAGTAGTSGFAGGAGGSGLIVVKEIF